MYSTTKRILTLVLLLCLCITAVAFPARAAYENTYTNTGDQRADLIGVALTQVGYREGSGGYTKYGDWFGAPYTDWCGFFVSWCANQAGIPTSVIRKNGFASASSFNIPSFTSDQKIPRPGDLFFKFSGTHTGIVYYVEGNYFYTIEGNTDEYSDSGVGVFIRKRKLSDYYYGEPPYQSDVGHNYEKRVESQHPHKVYYQCTDCSSKYYTGTTGTVDGCLQCLMEQCDHSYGNWRPLDNSTHMGTCQLCTKDEIFNHQWELSTILQEPTCENTGLAEEHCAQCGMVRQVTVPKTDHHQYGPWIYVDEESHYRVCQTCGRERYESHTPADWQWDRFEHFYECADCGEKAGMEAHSFEGDCESACTVCQYTRATGHLYSAKMVSDDTSHWYVCANCPAISGLQEHTYSAPCDETCNVCGHERQTEHTFSQQWTGNATGHWHECELCGKQDQVLPHTAGNAATEEHGQSCTVCAFEIKAAIVHHHSYTYQSDDKTHWGNCQCGDILSPESHTWDLQTGKCRICQLPLPQQEATTPLWMYLLPVIAAAAVIAAVAIGVNVKKKKAVPV